MFQDRGEMKINMMIMVMVRMMMMVKVRMMILNVTDSNNIKTQKKSFGTLFVGIEGDNILNISLKPIERKMFRNEKCILYFIHF